MFQKSTLARIKSWTCLTSTEVQFPSLLSTGPNVNSFCLSPPRSWKKNNSLSYLFSRIRDPESHDLTEVWVRFHEQLHHEVKRSHLRLTSLHFLLQAACAWPFWFVTANRMLVHSHTSCSRISQSRSVKHCLHFPVLPVSVKANAEVWSAACTSFSPSSFWRFTASSRFSQSRVPSATPLPACGALGAGRLHSCVLEGVLSRQLGVLEIVRSIEFAPSAAINARPAERCSLLQLPKTTCRLPEDALSQNGYGTRCQRMPCCQTKLVRSSYQVTLMFSTKHLHRARDEPRSLADLSCCQACLPFT